MLKLYSNIKRLRKLNNMSQQELAEAVGYAGKSMIAQVENGRINLPASMISKFAEVFHVTDLELMGLDSDDVDQETPIEIQIEKARDLYSQFESLPPDKQTAFLNYLKFLQSDS